MSLEIPDSVKDLLDRPIVVTLVTLMPDNTPQATPVWFNWDGEYIWVNTARGRAKDKNLDQRRKATILSVDPENPYRYLEVRGEVAETTEDGAVDHINYLSGRYTGNSDYYKGDTARMNAETRVIYKIKPTRVIPRG
ncbi:MAG: PPOX class F420-dependent oxidoreductase [Anaerolineae bacterium]|nr:PPOX class F420-dependent oxidoreductase [Anaerolineae bacterium]